MVAALTRVVVVSSPTDDPFLTPPPSQASVALLAGEGAEDGEADEDAKAQAVEDREALAALTAERDAHHGRLLDATLVGLFRAAITSRAPSACEASCQ